MDWLKNTSKYSHWNEDDKAELRTHFDDATSFDQVDFLLRESEKIMPKNPPIEVFNRLDSLFDQTYSVPKPIARPNRYYWRYSLLAAAAVLLAVLIVYPWFTRKPSRENTPEQAKKETFVMPKKKPTVRPHKSIREDTQEPLVASVEDDYDHETLDNFNEIVPLFDREPAPLAVLTEPTSTSDVAVPSMAQLESLKVDNSQELDEMSRSYKTLNEVSMRKLEDRKDLDGVEVAVLKKNNRIKSRKLDTGSMLKNIKPVF